MHSIGGTEVINEWQTEVINGKSDLERLVSIIEPIKHVRVCKMPFLMKPLQFFHVCNFSHVEKQLF